MEWLIPLAVSISTLYLVVRWRRQDRGIKVDIQEKRIVEFQKEWEPLKGPQDFLAAHFTAGANGARMARVELVTDGAPPLTGHEPGLGVTGAVLGPYEVAARYWALADIRPTLAAAKSARLCWVDMEGRRKCRPLSLGLHRHFATARTKAEATGEAE